MITLTKVEELVSISNWTNLMFYQFRSNGTDVGDQEPVQGDYDKWQLLFYVQD